MHHKFSLPMIRFLVGLCLIFSISACQEQAGSNSEMNINSALVDALNKSNGEIKLQADQSLQINPSQDGASWFKLSIGKHLAKHAKISFYPNQRQKSISFSKAGRYKVDVNVNSKDARPNQQQRQITLVVH